jgi:hypothetical protein
MKVKNRLTKKQKLHLAKLGKIIANILLNLTDEQRKKLYEGKDGK